VFNFSLFLQGSQPGQRAVPQEHVGDYEAFDSETQYGDYAVAMMTHPVTQKGLKKTKL
jgi:hypothetical protein